MSNMMPFIMSSPPPIDDCEEEEDDEFGNFRVADHTFSLTDLNQTNDSPEIEKSWVESTQNQDEFPNISSNNSFQNEAFDIVTSNGLTNMSVTPLGNHLHMQEINRVTTETSCRLFSESENLQVDDDIVINNLLLKPQMNRVNVNLQSVASDKNEENIFDKGISEIVFPFSTDKEEGTRTGDLEPNERNGSDIKECVSGNICDDFNEFTDFTSGNSLSKFENLSIKESKNLVVSATQVQDDFDDFDDFESAEFTLCTVKKEPTVEETLKILFGTPNEVANEVTVDTAGLTDSLHSCLDDSSSVWGHLKELETSHALSYQWSNSATNKIFLSSLNVDCRNIFFGVRWNLCVPRFAANLGVNPLEPVKATEMNSMNLASASSTAEDLVPAAQFDWTSSGLTNPLDASHLTLLDLDFFTKFDDISSSSHAAFSLWNHSSLEKENTATSAKEPTMRTIVEPLGADTVKPIVDDIFESIGGEIVDREEDEVAETMISHPTVSSASDSDLRKKDEISAEAYAIVESFPDLSFLSARKLMLAAEENMSRWRLKP